MIVEKYKLGNTTIIICDDSYKDKTKEDIDAIIKRIELIASRALSKQYNEGVFSNEEHKWKKLNEIKS